MSLEELEKAAGNDGYVISKYTGGYTVRLRGAAGRGATLAEAISDAISTDAAQDAELSLLDD